MPEVSDLENVHGEATLEELLDEPIIRLWMASHGVDEAAVRHLAGEIAERCRLFARAEEPA